MSGALVLQGGGPFTANDDLDRRLLAGVDGYVAVLPTADAFEGPERLVASAVEWAGRHGVTVRTCEVYTRNDARETAHAETIRSASAVWIVGDSPIHLRSALMGTAVYSAIEDRAANALVVAVAGSAAALCDPMVDPRGGAYAIGLGLVSGLALITESESWSRERLSRSLSLADTTVVELPTTAALERRDGTWQVHGPAVVHGELPA